MKFSHLLTCLSFFNTKSTAMDIFSPLYPTKIIKPQLMNINSAFIYAETPEILFSSEERLKIFNYQTEYLNRLFNSPSFEINFYKYKGIPAFNEQNNFIKQKTKYNPIFIGQNEILIRELMHTPFLQTPKYDLNLLAMETMLHSQMIIMVFDISKFNQQTKFVFRQGFPFESIRYQSQKHSIENIPIIEINNKIIGSPFLPEHLLPLSSNTKKVLITIFQLGKNSFLNHKNFNSLSNEFIENAQTRCHLKLSNVHFFKGIPIFDEMTDCTSDIKIFVDLNSKNNQNFSQK